MKSLVQGRIGKHIVYLELNTRLASLQAHTEKHFITVSQQDIADILTSRYLFSRTIPS